MLKFDCTLPLSITLTVASLIACYAQASASAATAETVAVVGLSGDSESALKSNLPHLHINQIDAPKYYHLNALLYKPLAPRSDSEANLRPLSGAREEEGSAIDSLIRAMRRKQSSQADSMSRVTYEGTNRAERKGIAMSNDDNNENIGPDDEATIQRKSIDNLDGSSRLRSRSEPRRKRRAIVRRVPPKLQSRRISKLSRRARTKLRLKPKRRA